MGWNARKTLSALAGSALLVLGALAAEAQEAALGTRATDVGEAVVVPLVPETYGTAGLTVHTVPAYAFEAWDDSTQSHTGYNRFSPTGQEVEAPLFLPNGAQIESIELQGCDTDGAGSLVFVLIRATNSGAPVLLSPTGTTGDAQTPGCGLFLQPLTTFHTVDNSNTYYVAVHSSTTSATSYTAVRVRYRLQVSPAPGVATFSDVPTNHQFFRFVEALAAAGITGGCGAGMYCPDNAVTRGQMAVFLSIALGLHFPN